MKRRHFTLGLTAAGAVLNIPARVLSRTTEDPATSADTQALRVLLGRGRLEPIDSQTFTFEGRKYRGTAATLPDTGQVVSTVPLEQYLYSVVSREMPRSWPSAALQAQAILARTYVLQRSNPTRTYDLVPSEADQVYTGIDAESAPTTAAVDATTGKALRFGGGFAEIAYSSCCGGHTESSADAWGGSRFPYLGGVPCDYCKDSSWYRWTQSIPAASALNGLGAQSSAIGDLQEIVLDSVDASGRARFWIFNGSGGSVRVKASDMRRAIGSRVLPSLLVRTISVDGDTLKIDGAGLGHGVGFCQWGARGLAQTGASGEKILAYYFPGTTIGVF